MIRKITQATDARQNDGVIQMTIGKRLAALVGRFDRGGSQWISSKEGIVQAALFAMVNSAQSASL